MSKVYGRQEPFLDKVPAPSPSPLGRLDRLALALTEPAAIRRWYALVIAICVALIAVTILVLVYVMPEGSDIAGTVEFYRKHNTLLRVVAAGLALMFLLGVIWSAAFISTLWGADTSPNRIYTWTAIFSEILVLGLFFTESGIFAGTVLLSGHSPDSIIHALHVTVLVSAALLGPVWVPFAWAALLISRRTGLCPPWFNRLCVVVIVIDLCTVTGVFTLTGPLNGENGLVGAFAGVLSPVVWVGGAIAWEVVEWARVRALPLWAAPASN
ncbi:hypothetical protein D7D52_33740 [Nocardia yunnanensis]|uniref:DUF998 domain-containing protein n=1 Tax=Nocardia yunnanensis TaxID=2382165 RepID=A0A386ZKX5_9NOCA|nr:hypothetical protein [Nocardia yunnanensis]AYF77960.1 hypothetical protein D7D52_33740 [Nocardia yunnanensis]